MAEEGDRTEPPPERVEGWTEAQPEDRPTDRADGTMSMTAVVSDMGTRHPSGR
jgi:hypothetical protein